MNNRRLILSEVNEAGVLFQVPVFASTEMEAWQVLGELKVAESKLDAELIKWDKTWKR
jgi:hypothetical protein